jgi:hypothetical protein
VSDSITAKIAKILNQAENAGTNAEAEVFMRKAQELATTYSVDLAKARHMTIAKERTVPVVRTITMGVRGTKGLNTLVRLFQGIAEVNDIKFNIARNSTYVIAFGFEEDIDVAEALFTSLSVQMAAAAAEYRKTGEWKKDTRTVGGRWIYRNKVTGKQISRTEYERYYWHNDIVEEWVGREEKPVSWLTARLDFQQSFARRVGSRLAQAKFDAMEKVHASEMLQGSEQAKGDVGYALVLVEKKEAVANLYKEKSNARGSYRGGWSGGGAYTSSRAGSAAGANARISSSASIGSRKAIA